MASLMEKELQLLETSMDAKLRSLRGPDQEEHKGEALLNKRLYQLRSALEQACDQIMIMIEQKVREMMDPLKKAHPQITTILNKLQQQKQNIMASPRTEKRKIATRMKSLQDFAEIEEKIKLLEVKPSLPINPETLIQFNKEEIYETLKKIVTIEGCPLTDQKSLVYQKGIINLDTGNQLNIKPEFTVPKAHTSLQHENKLYICGGRKLKDNKLEFLNQFFVSNGHGKCEALNEMSEGRECLSLSGCDNILVALGGFNGSVLKIAQEYNINSNLWNSLPDLNAPRQCPGSCILLKKRVFCFCGYKDFGNLNSIEHLSLNESASWTQLHVNQKVAKTQQIVAIPYDSQIVVFGGTQSIGYSMFLFTEQGQLTCDLSTLPNIPGYMCQGVAIEHQGKIYAVGQRREWKEKFKAQVFDGMSWQSI